MRGGIRDFAASEWRRVEALAVSALIGALVALVWAPGASAAPANDDFASAQDLGSSLPVSVAGSNVGATAEVGEPRWVLAAAGHSIWFKWTAAETGSVTAETCGSEPVTVLGVYKGATVGALTEITGDVLGDGPPPFCDGAEASFEAIAGSTYMISVDTEAGRNVGTEGAISLGLRHTPPPPNDSFAQAEPLQLDDLSTSGANWGATRELGEPLHRGDPGGASVWYRVTANRNGGILVSACNGDFWGDVAVYSGVAASILTPVAADESGRSCEYLFDGVARSTYFIAVDGKPGSEPGGVKMGSFLIRAESVPPNDDFEEAFELHGGIGVHSLLGGSGNFGATKEPGEPDHAGNPGGASIWFTWTASQAGSFYLSPCGGNFDALVAVYTGDRLGSLQPVASDHFAIPSSCPLSEDPPPFGFNVSAGRTYMIAVDGYGGARARFAIETYASDRPIPPPSQPKAAAAPPPGSGPVTVGARSPQTRIAKRRIQAERGRAVFFLGSDQPGSWFNCRLDKRAQRKCQSRVVFRHLAAGRHVFRAAAVDSVGADPTPVVVRFRVHR